MVQNKVVAHFSDGHLVKGVTGNFRPGRDVFHIQNRDDERLVEVDVTELKGVFFVKDYDGNPDYDDRPDVERRGMGRRVRVRFRDRETIVGYTQSYSPAGTGFFMAPADPDSNNERVFVVRAATEEVQLV